MGGIRDFEEPPADYFWLGSIDSVISFMISSLTIVELLFLNTAKTYHTRLQARVLQRISY